MRRADFAQELAVATRLARAAGAAILEVYAGRVEVAYKGGGTSDPVTDADRRANAIIVEGLSREFPQDAILAEETVPEIARHQKPRLWCVDPLDGTREFIDKNGQFVVMIGLAIDGLAACGVVYQPTEDLLLAGGGGEAFAEVGGARRALCPTLTADPRQARMMVSRSHRSATVTKVAASLGISNEEPLGSVGLKVSRVATGSADLYLSVSNQTHEWDACAPDAILTAAGGTFSDCLGNPLRYNKKTTQTPYGILATNGPLHQSVVRALAPIARERGWG
ncbi:MAG: 3'(2'),5'-bisphosphate nucleotidase CysQ [Deltaproteobacteria bacterium]|nr:3'(2'),5'-bisphosphate nucleotidase CysQ [Deltaproteobacteria bacterium]